MQKSGSNNFNILSIASRKLMIANGDKSFNHLKIWLVCRDGLKWVLNPESLSESPRNSNKRLITFESDVSFGLDINVDFDETDGRVHSKSYFIER